MKPTTMATWAAIGALVATGSAAAQQQTAHQPDHRIVAPQDIRWAAGLPSLPRGSEVAVLYGNPAMEGPFAMRLRFPADYRIPAHSHPGAEVVTILSGTFGIGMGSGADKGKTQAIPAGGFVALPPNSPHFAFIEEPTVVQINSIGPWAVNYVNTNEDPRKQ
ncbi:cupin domain-containing protein [Roseomonas xinghualingensis]|uniref:cupin domain-containing protein n=1 Tax=Roseomonas xinghualingensis TaxID=2986475 RepID=UPI0021F230A2|nr:cupin domain-containing protein [Roseomonas sp. SXEYE001]MCV4210083.1 cupin domain-containing protein [Roseomonas sp. SXEYE001]